MPGIKRWFPVSQHINRDPQLWEICNLYGDRALRIWLEVLSIADRNDGIIPGASADLSPDLRRALADASRTSGQTVANCWRRFQEYLWIIPSIPARVANWRDYHRNRKTNSRTTDVAIGSLPSEPSEPSLAKEALKSAEHFKNKIVGLVASMSKNGHGEEKPQALMLWVNGKRKEVKDDRVGMELIIQTLERLKTREDNGTEVKSYGRYLDALYQKVRTESLQAENEKLKHQPIPDQLKSLVGTVGKRL